MYDEALLALIVRMLALDVAKRPSVSQCLAQMELIRDTIASKLKQ